MEPVVKEAYKVPHLPYDDFPPLADYDAADHLVKTSWPLLDPFLKANKGRHLFWGLMSRYR